MVKIITSNIQFCSGSVSQNNCDGIACENPDAKPVLDKIIRDNLETSKKENKKTSLFHKLTMYPTFGTLTGIFVGLSLAALDKIIRLKKQVKKSIIPKEKLSEYTKKLPKKFSILAGKLIAIGFVIDLLNKNYKDKNKNKAVEIVNDFNKKNNTNIELKIKPVNSLLIRAFADPVSGQLTMHEKLIEDLIYANTYQEPALKHELIHSKQYILMACAENGIEKMNYITIKQVVKTLNEFGKKEVYDAYQEIKNGVSDKYKNATLDRFGYKINMVDYIIALYKVIYEEKTTPKDIPIIINKEFYQQVRDKKGKLSPKEKEKAKKYFEAYEKYPNKLGFFEAFNPNSDYRQNLLEKEAYKVMPWYTYIY